MFKICDEMWRIWRRGPGGGSVTPIILGEKRRNHRGKKSRRGNQNKPRPPPTLSPSPFSSRSGSATDSARSAIFKAAVIRKINISKNGHRGLCSTDYAEFDHITLYLQRATKKCTKIYNAREGSFYR